MRIGSTPITDIKVGSTQITKVIRNGITYWQVDWTPLRLVATAVSDVGIDLTWTNVDTEGDGVSIERSTDGITYAEIATVVLSVATYSNTGLTTGARYYYRIRAYRGTQYSSYSNVANTWASNTFKLELTTTVINQSVTLPHLAGYVYNYTVDYGDDSGLKTVTSYNDADCTHTYVSAGVYMVKIVGTCETFYVNNGAIKLFITKILSWGNVGLKGINFYSCTNLTSIAGDSSGLSLVTTFIDAFRGCSKLASIPSGIFDKCINVTSFSGIFYSCVLVTSIPSGLFDKNILATNFINTFRLCTKITSIPSGLFDKNINITTFWGTFISCTSITSIPSGLFNNNTLVTDFSWTFYNTFLSSIPAGLFDNNPLVTLFKSVFSGVPSLFQPFTSIPAGLFDYNPLVTVMANAFEHCTSLALIPPGLFDHNPLVTDFKGAFYKCFAITSIPPGLFDNNLLVTEFGSVGPGTGNGIFTQTTITSIPQGLFDHNPLVTLFESVFKDCTSLTSIPSGLFDNNLSVTRFANCFYNCTALDGNTPELWLRVPEPAGSQCFYNCTGLINYASIPANWK